MLHGFEEELFAFTEIQENSGLGLKLFIASSGFMQKIAASILLSASFSFLSTGFIPAYGQSLQNQFKGQQDAEKKQASQCDRRWNKSQYVRIESNSNNESSDERIYVDSGGTIFRVWGSNGCRQEKVAKLGQRKTEKVISPNGGFYLGSKAKEYVVEGNNLVLYIKGTPASESQQAEAFRYYLNYSNYAIIVPLMVPESKIEKHIVGKKQGMQGNGNAEQESGYAKFNSGDYQGAISDYSKAIAINPQDANAYYSRGLSKYNLKDYQEAIADYSKAIAINPRMAITYVNRGAAKSDLRDYQGAIADYSKAIAINPQDASAYYNRGLAKSNLKDYQGAIADYSKAIMIDPNHYGASSNRGLAKSNLKDYQGAIADYDKAIAINPRGSIPYSNRGIVKELLGDKKGACSDWEKASSIDSKSSANDKLKEKC